MTKLLWHSNAPWVPTGYGQQTGLFLPELKKHYQVACSSFYGLEGAPKSWEDIMVFPGVGGTYGDQPLVDHAKHFFDGDPRNGLVVTLMDVWVLNPHWMSQINTVSWVPVDHDPAPPRVVQFFADSGAVPMAMSRFGQQMLGRLDPLYVPHAVNTDVYRPTGDREKIRESAFPKGAFVVGMVAANKGRPSRKGFSQAFQAFRKLLEKHENSFLYLHTTIDPAWSEGENIPALLRELEIPMDRIRIADQYAMTLCPYSHEQMAQLYSSLDVLLNPATGEGFGIPVLEAQACGTPAIVTDFSAMSEVCGAGWRVDHQPYWTGQNSWQAVPDVGGIADALIECREMSPTDRDRLSTRAREHALGYSLPVVMDEFMLPALRAAEQRFANQNPVTISPRLKQAA